jgi:glycosyltransferase involved in cell wall biosynthesis
MKICIVGKFPPIQGGVSMRTYWTAHALAARGHDVHVVTNAKEVRPPFRMHMRVEDWQQCEPKFADGGVTVHWTDPIDRSQSHIPMASPFVSKLATLAAHAQGSRPFDVIYSHYMEPYGIAGHLAAQMTGAPHVVRMAGSDAGRLWHHPQFEALYDHVLRAAAIVIATGTVAARAVRRGVDTARIAPGGAYPLPAELFTPAGPALDLPALRRELARDPEVGEQLWGGFAGDRPYFGVYGKLGERKGSFALLGALQRIAQAGADVGLVALAHGNADVEHRFRARAVELGLADRILQLPFLPHWRVPEFLRGCLAVCCLEQDFPIGFHSPVVAREVLLCGACLVGSSEIIRKIPQWERLPHGYGCVAIEDIDNVAVLADRLSAIGRDPHRAAAVGARGYAFAQSLEQGIDFPAPLVRILARAADRAGSARSITPEPDPQHPASGNGRFPIARMAIAALGRAPSERAHDRRNGAAGLKDARRVLARIERAVADGRQELRALARGVEVEVAIATAERDADRANGAPPRDPLFRLAATPWAIEDCELPAMVPIRDPQLRVVRFDFEAAGFREVQTAADLPVDVAPGPSHIVVFAQRNGARREPVLVDSFTARVLARCDGSRTAGEIIQDLRGHPRQDLHWIEQLFVQGLIDLQSKTVPAQHSATTRRDHKVVPK